jgi:hypothetical protein
MRKVAVLLLATMLTLIGQPQFVSAAEESWITDPSIPAVYALGNCRTAIELDCIESVEYAKRGEGYAVATFTGTSSPTEYTEPNGNFIKQFNTDWVVGEDAYQVLAQLETQSHKIGTTGVGAALRVTGYYMNTLKNPDPLNRKIRIKVRTSWLRPMNVQLKANEAGILDEVIPGGRRWTLEGYATQISQYTENMAANLSSSNPWSMKADVDTPILAFYLHHADTDLTKGYWSPICADKGYMVQSHNTDATGDPMWDAATDSLVFSIFAPHTKADGTPNIGFFKLWASEKFLDCKYPTNTLTKSAKLTVQILYEDGTVTAVSTVVNRNNGNIFFSADGFHYSAPKVILKAEAPAPTPSPTPSATPSPTPSATLEPKPTPSAIVAPAKKVTITCVKGKVTKKVTAVKPVCPKGYKKK